MSKQVYQFVPQVAVRWIPGLPGTAASCAPITPVQRPGEPPPVFLCWDGFLQCDARLLGRALPLFRNVYVALRAEGVPHHDAEELAHAAVQTARRSVGHV